MALKSAPIERIQRGLELLRIAQPQPIEDFKMPGAAPRFFQTAECTGEMFDIQNQGSAALGVRLMECGDELTVENILGRFLTGFADFAQ